MLYYGRIDISEGIDRPKSNRSKECMICHYWLFNHVFKFKDSVCNACHDLTMLSIKVGLSPSKKICFICFNKIPLKAMKNAFFHTKNSFFSQDI